MMVTGDTGVMDLRSPTVSEASTLDDESVTKSRSERRPAEGIRVIPIHLRPDLLLPCADLVNSEWQRSQAARVHSLQKSCPEFPICLVLLQGSKDAERILGHARLSRVVDRGGSLFVESVVVSKAERGKGYGRTLMEETERYAKSRGFSRLCLTTHDKQHFYAHIGYALSTPVQNAGAVASFVPMEMLVRFSRMPDVEVNMQKQTQKVGKGHPVGTAGPPPQCSIPQLSPTSSILPPPPPPPPPPPSTPPPPGGEPMIQTLTKTPYRDAKGVSIFWMHKDL
ncbi:N-alpha-acetyltransferase 80 [Syngnathoides biaculeatus]|uniref:N-alpha-acetyltransferase 80 n=1 Tax=Syngnathoides biaculeatus TaxID=300417 RepID=UPI002ADE7045|nr:N-alpha-acetyltransferase 80 [Syngnathoides biaculeatus]XP_061689161.1 N-alpha-acetyltransferase 80 [Syngnathoides biaculeatus]